MSTNVISVERIADNGYENSLVNSLTFTDGENETIFWHFLLVILLPPFLPLTPQPILRGKSSLLRICNIFIYWFVIFFHLFASFLLSNSFIFQKRKCRAVLKNSDFIQFSRQSLYVYEIRTSWIHIIRLKWNMLFSSNCGTLFHFIRVRMGNIWAVEML